MPKPVSTKHGQWPVALLRVRIPRRYIVDAPFVPGAAQSACSAAAPALKKFSRKRPVAGKETSSEIRPFEREANPPRRHLDMRRKSASPDVTGGKVA